MKTADTLHLPSEAHPRASVLQTLMAVGPLLANLGDAGKMCGLARSTLLSVPGLSAVDVRLSDAESQTGAEGAETRPDESHPTTTLSIRSGNREFGSVMVSITDAEVFHHYRGAVENVLGILGMRLDARAREHALEREVARQTESLELQRVFLESVLDGSFDLITVYDQWGNIVRQNRAAIDAAALDPDHPGGSNAGPFWRAASQDDLLADTLRSGHATEVTVAVPRRDDDPRWYSVAYIPIVEVEQGMHELILETGRDITEAKLLELELSAALEAKDLVMSEVHHRVKNNLNVVASVLRLQFQDYEDPSVQRSLEASLERVRTIATVHQQLQFAESHETVDAGTFFKALVEDIGESYSLAGLVDVNVTIGSQSLSSRQASAAGLILNELLSNAFKYAYPEGDGAIRVCSERDPIDPSTYCVTVADDGVGVAEDDLDGASDSLGMTVVHALADQLGGSVWFTQTNPGAPRPGLTARICFPIASA